jgi:hypothetical protein
VKYLEELRPDQSLTCFTDRRQASRFLGNLAPIRDAVSVH